MSIIIERISDGQRFTIEDNQVFPGAEFKVIDSIRNIERKEKQERIIKEYYEAYYNTLAPCRNCNENHALYYYQ